MERRHPSFLAELRPGLVRDEQTKAAWRGGHQDAWVIYPTVSEDSIQPAGLIPKA